MSHIIAFSSNVKLSYGQDCVHFPVWQPKLQLTHTNTGGAREFSHG